jgi:hypothetical protein
MEGRGEVAMTEVVSTNFHVMVGATGVFRKQSYPFLENSCPPGRDLVAPVQPV